MSETVIKLENIGKQYRLGTVGSLLFSNPGLVKLNFEQAKFLAELNRGKPCVVICNAGGITCVAKTTPH